MADMQKERIENEEKKNRVLNALRDPSREYGQAMAPFMESPVQAVGRALTRIIDDTAKQATLERENLLREISQMDEQLNKYSVAWWDETHRTLLLTPHLLKMVPDAVYLVSIDGERKLAGAVKEGLDAKETRFGVTAWGIPLDNAVQPQAAKRKHRRVRPLPNDGAVKADTKPPETPAP